MKLKSIKNFEFAGKTVLVRAGLDVSFFSEKIKDDFRVRSVVPTIMYLADKGAKVVVISHFGRPEGWQESMGLEPIARHLAEIMQRKFVPVSITDKTLPDYPVPHLFFFRHNIERTDMKPILQQMKAGDIAVLENIRFYPGEMKNDPEFAQKLASLGDFYINDAFSDAHRQHASIVGLPKFLPSTLGLSFTRELEMLERFMTHPKKPVVVLMGGIKISGKLLALERLAKIADYILLGGGLACLFLKIAGFEVGRSTWEESRNDEKIARGLWRDLWGKIYLPIDAVVAANPNGVPQCVTARHVKPSQMILDIGPETILLYSSILKKGHTLIWNGPMGYIENRNYAHGTLALGRLFASRTKTTVSGIAGGGETLEAIADMGMEKFIDHVSTGGGSLLAYLAGSRLPGLEILTSQTGHGRN